ncbi:DUF4097 family beta strand repeat-containing protein [Kitasatospora sp. NPDC086801]|uniref:DUF4097 family beta strand repeat-containing protein n=1 Tax=Kitasatospora sp. NPDC086801 TaxID=3364066 RepID=UPI0038282188
MSTSQTATATRAQHLNLDLPEGLARVTVRPDAVVPTITIHTDDDQGAAADAVRGVRWREEGDTLTVTVPRSPGTTMSFTGGRGVTVIQNFGTVAAGTTVVGMTIGAGGRVTFGGGSGQIISPVVADIVLPPHGAMAFRTSSADLEARGAMLGLAVDSSSGDIQAESVEILAVETSSGDVTVGRVGDSLQVKTSSGDVRIGAYEGTLARIHASSGDVTFRAMPRSNGPLDIRTSSGDIRVTGADHLQLSTRTSSGDVRRR